MSGFQGDREGLRTIHFKIEFLSVEKKKPSYLWKTSLLFNPIKPMH